MTTGETELPYGVNAWQRLCSQELLRCLALNVNQTKKVRRWRKSKRYLERSFQVPTGQGYGTNLERVVLADLDLSAADLSGFDFRRTYVARVNFQDAILKNTDFRQSILSECTLTGAQFSGSDLSRANIRASVIGFGEIRYDDFTRMSGIDPSALPPSMPPGLIDRIHKDNRRFGKFGAKRSKFERLFLAWTNYGRSAPAIMMIAGFVWLIFGLVHLWFTQFTDLGWQGWPNVREAAMLSAEALVGLDASMPTEVWWRSAFIAETGFGILVLALVVASMTNKIVELSSDA